MEIATQNPDHIVGAVISNTTAFPAWGANKAFSYFARTLMVQRLFRNRNILGGVVLPSMLSEDTKKNKAVLEAYSRPFPTRESRGGCAEFPRQITVQTPWFCALEKRLKVLENKPIEFVFGLKDPFTGSQKMIDKWTSIFPRGNVVKLPDANHFTQEDSPESYAVAIRNIMKQHEAGTKA